MKSSEFIIEKLEELDFNTVLEVGCGVGGLTTEIIDTRVLERYVACDIDADYIIEITKKLYGAYTYFTAHFVDYLKLHSNQMELVIASHVLEEYNFYEKHGKLTEILDKMCKDSSKYVIHTCTEDAIYMEYWMAKKEEWSITGYNIDEKRKIIISERI